MEELSIAQARTVKETFLQEELPESLRQTINGVGLCLVNQEPPMFGVVINLREDFDESAIRAHFPAELQDNVQIKTVGAIHARTS